MFWWDIQTFRKSVTIPTRKKKDKALRISGESVRWWSFAGVCNERFFITVGTHYTQSVKLRYYREGNALVRSNFFDPKSEKRRWQDLAESTMTAKIQRFFIVPKYTYEVSNTTTTTHLSHPNSHPFSVLVLFRKLYSPNESKCTTLLWGRYLCINLERKTEHAWD